METLKTKKNIVPFNGQRYSIWKRRIRALLNELDVLKVIDEDPPEMVDDEWNKAERTAKGVIIQFLCDSLLSFAEEHITAKEIVQKLDTLYERKSLPSQLAIRKQLLEMKFKGDTPLIIHFTVFEDFMIELLAAGAQLTETDKIAHLLLTLPADYNGVITALETLSEENITLAFVKTRLLDQEVKLKNTSTTSLKVLHVETAKTNFGQPKPNNQQNKTNWKNSRKPWRGNFNQKQNRSRQYKSQNYGNNPTTRFSNIKCNHCGRKNHLKRDCFYYKRMIQNQSNNQEDRPRTIQTVQTTSNSESGFAFMAGNLDTKPTKNEIIFLLDSGASDHLVNTLDVFNEVVDLMPPLKISIAKNDVFITATKRGSIPVITNLGIEGVLQDVLYSHEVPYNLLSVRRIQQAGMSVIFNETEGVEIQKGGKSILTGKSLNDLISVIFKINKKDISNKINMVTNNTSSSKYKIWHERLGHIGKTKFLELKNNEMVDDVNLIKQIHPNDDICESCIYGKQSKLPFSKSKDKNFIKRPLFIIHSDVCGPIKPSTYDNKNYFVIFIDSYTHYTVTYLITFKSEVFAVFKDFVAKSQAHFNLKTVHLYCDNGGEYLSNEFKEFCVQNGISYHLTVPHTPAQNGVAERMIRTITEKGRAMISGADLNKSFWGEAVLTATYLINRTPTKALNNNKTPYELWHNKKPRLNHLRIFGSTVYMHNKTRKTKFEEKSLKCILVGYEPNGYKVWSVETEKCLTARDVIIDEINFKITRPLYEIKTLENEPNKSVIEPDTQLCLDPDSYAQSNVEPKLRQSERIKKQAKKISYNENEVENYQVEQDYLLCAQSLICSSPKSYQEIKTRNDRNQWEQAINDELNSLIINNTWFIVPRPPNKNIIDSKWVFTIKNDEFGNPIKYKARLVARGFSQQYLVDYDETFAPVARISTFRILLAFANQFRLLVHHMDVKTAFLNGTLRDDIYMKIPEGIKAEKDKVCKLNKALYGLKQASRCWFELFDETLKQKGFKNSLVDRCLYLLDKGHINKNIYLVLYVDDLVIACANMETMTNFKQYLMKQFSMVDLKEINFFLGIKINRSEDTITLDQSAYLKTVLTKFNMIDCKSVNTPLTVNLNYTALNSETNYEAPSRRLIGCLMYAMMCTRPDLSTAVNILSRYQNKNNHELWQNLKRVLRYIKGSLDIKLTYVRGEYNKIIVGFVDSDWGSNENDRKSTTGYVFKLFECCTISWNTKRQNSVAASSTEAEYMALFEGVREALWLKSILTSINMHILEPITIYEDNTGCINIANNPTCHKRSKHIDIKYHFSREQVEQKTVILEYIPTGEQIADVFTKPLPGPQFLKLRTKVGLD